MEHIDIERLRQQAREQLDVRESPTAAWVRAFESALHETLMPRVKLFLEIMAAAGNPGLEGRGDRSGHTRGWIIGHLETQSLPDPFYNTVSISYTSLVLSPALDLGTVTADPQNQSAEVVNTPRLTTHADGEIRKASALGEIVLEYYYRQHPCSPQTYTREFAADCDRRMLALLCAHELTFPDRDLSTVQWNTYEQRIIADVSEKRRLARRPPMTVDEFASFIDGTMSGEDAAEKNYPRLTGSEFAKALSLTTHVPERRWRYNWRNKHVDAGEKGWQVSEWVIEKTERNITTARVYLRRDGSGFEEWSYTSGGTEVTAEFSADHVYETSTCAHIHKLRGFRLRS